MQQETKHLHVKFVVLNHIIKPIWLITLEECMKVSDVDTNHSNMTFMRLDLFKKPKLVKHMYYIS